MAPRAGRADTVTPSLTASLGYTDNIRFRSTPVSDGFMRITPGFSLDYGKPARKLSAIGSLRYAQYLNHPSLNQVESAALDASYFHAFSQRTNLKVGDKGSLTYDAPVFDEDGGLVRIRTDGGRRSQNKTYLRAEHGWGRNNLAWLGYSYVLTRYSTDDERDSQGHEAEVGLQLRFNPTWEGRLKLWGNQVDYNALQDIMRNYLQAELFYNLNQTQRLTFLGRYSTVSEEKGYDQDGRDYQTYTFQLGYLHQVSPRLSWSLLMGMSNVVGDTAGNRAAGDDFPAITANLTWREKHWELKLVAETSLGEYDIYGSNSGLTYRKRAGLVFSYGLAQHWELSTEGYWVKNQYEQDPYLETSTGEDTTSYRGLARLTWKAHRYWGLSFEYLYQEIQGDQSLQDRTENQVMLNLTGAYPYRW